MNIQTKMNIWNSIISAPKKTVIEYKDLIKASFENCREGEEIFNIEDKNGNTPLSLAQESGNDFLINVILSHGGRNLNFYSRTSSLNRAAASRASSNSAGAFVTRLNQQNPEAQKEMVGKKRAINEVDINPSSSSAVASIQRKSLSKEEFVELSRNELVMAAKDVTNQGSSTVQTLASLRKAFNRDYSEGINIFAEDYKCKLINNKLHPLLWVLYSILDKKLLAGNIHLFKDQINYQDPYYKRTFLMMVASENNLDLVKEALENGADLTITNQINYTALDFARKSNATEIIELLEQAMGINNQTQRIVGAKRAKEENSVSSSSSSSAMDPAVNLNTSSSSSSAGTFVIRLNQQNLEAQGEVVGTKKARKDDESSSMNSSSSWKSRTQNQQNNNDLSK